MFILSFSLVWDVVQTELKCCGVKNATDWFRYFSRTKNKSRKILPESCCETKPFESTNGGYECTYGDSKHPHNMLGCLEGLENHIKRNEGTYIERKTFTFWTL